MPTWIWGTCLYSAPLNVLSQSQEWELLFHMATALPVLQSGLGKCSGNWSFLGLQWVPAWLAVMCSRWPHRWEVSLSPKNRHFLSGRSAIPRLFSRCQQHSEHLSLQEAVGFKKNPFTFAVLFTSPRTQRGEIYWLQWKNLRGVPWCICTLKAIFSSWQWKQGSGEGWGPHLPFSAFAASLFCIDPPGEGEIIDGHYFASSCEVNLNRGNVFL